MDKTFRWKEWDSYTYCSVLSDTRRVMITHLPATRTTGSSFRLTLTYKAEPATTRGFDTATKNIELIYDSKLDAIRNAELWLESFHSPPDDITNLKVP